MTANDTASEPSVSRGPRWKRASTEVLALVTGPEIAALVGRTIVKDQALLALAGRQKVAERMCRRGLLATERAGAAGVTWHEVDTALGYWPGLARRDDYRTAMSRQDSLGPVVADRHDPGTPQGQPP